MALRKREYTDKETLITAENMNAIQDAIIALEDGLFAIDAEKNGTVITMTDASTRGIRNLKIYGKTTQAEPPTPSAPVDLVSTGDGGILDVLVTGKNILPYPYQDTTKTVNGVAFTVNNDGSISTSGTATGSANFWLTGYTFNIKKGVTYTLSLGNDFTVTGDPFFWIAGTSSNIVIGINMSKQRTATFTPTQDEKNVAVYIIASNVGSVFSGTIRPQLEVGTAVTEYERHKGQVLTIATPNDLPGIPVSSGGNYTDENGQDWVCDEIDFERGVYVQRIGKVNFNGTEAWSYYTEANLQQFYTEVPAKHSTNEIGAMCKYYRPVPISNRSGNYGTIYTHASGIAFNSNECSTIEAWKALLSQRPITVLYILKAEAPKQLTDEELDAYAALRTYRGNTTVSNDGNAYMELEYIVDTKTYFDGLLGSDVIYPATIE